MKKSTLSQGITLENYYLYCLVIFIFFYGVSITLTSVFYHRAITHSAIELNPILKSIFLKSSVWLTGIEPKGWACMHRMHHQYSDGPSDPHSPHNNGVFGLFLAQSKKYEEILDQIRSKDPKIMSVIEDLDFPLHPLYQSGSLIWLTPYFSHAALALCFGYFTGFWLMGACYFVGLMSHPVQGWMVNSFGHFSGKRNFDLPDKSTNNFFVMLLCLGEGLQNNHHQYPDAAKFSLKWYEIDMGYSICLVLSWLGLLKFSANSKVP
ncbi:MAG: acyl-CoA desaturase [Bacteriovoracaceae bacterium]|jgi:stearoyl-CoA desaturase (Delta-9 desaturase)|nr:acyl-CoA desaturase [Bacteriovoracaceae bacterium]